VYGLGADAFNQAALKNIFVAKARPQDNPLIVHIGDVGQVSALVAHVPAVARLLMDALFPGPLTLVLPKADGVSSILSAGLDTIGVRMPRHRTAIEFLRACATAVAAPSANLSGRPSPTTWQAVLEDLDGRIDCILQGESTEIGLESTVVDCTSDVPEILRQGAISAEQLRGVVPQIRLHEQRDSDAPKSPGMRHRHYSPRARIVIGRRPAISDERSAAFIGITPPAGNFVLRKLCPSVDVYARSVFEFFRECDRFGVETIYCEPVNETGIGAALMERLRRAAED
jgi:L-threonylcarbamoyladenylate synthase